MIEVNFSGKKNSHKTFLVDEEDHMRVTKIKWYLTSQGYVRSRHIFLHRYLLDAPKNMEVDHKNRIKTDNRKENLRLCTAMENSQNKRKSGTGWINKLTIKGHTYYTGRIKKHLKVYQTTTCATPEEARGALKQMIKDYKLRWDKYE